MARSMKRKSCAYRRQGTTKQRKSMKRKVQSTPQRGGNGCGIKPLSQRGGGGCRRPVSQRGSGRGHNHGSVGPASRAGPYRRLRSGKNRKRVICAGDDCPQRKR